MDSYVIITDSSADFDDKMVQELGVDVLPLRFTLDEVTYANWPDGREISFSEFYKRLRQGGSSSTSQVNSSEFTETFRPLLKSGKDVLYLGFSSGLSGTVNSARIAAQELAEEFPQQTIKVVDTLSASLGQGLLVWYACRKKKEGASLAEVAQWVEDNRLKLAHWFSVDDLNFLKRGGRLSGTAAFFGTMLNIKPVLHVDNEGHLIAMDKVRGRRQSLIALVDQMEKSAINPKDQTVFISHGDCQEDAEFLAQEVKKRFGTKDIGINYVGPVIGSHSGPGTIALFFMASQR